MKDNKHNRVFPSSSFDKKNNPWIIDSITGMWGKFNESQDTKLIMGMTTLSDNFMAEYIDLVLCSDNLVFVPGWQNRKPSLKIVSLITNEEFNIQLEKRNIRDSLKDFALFSKGVYCSVCFFNRICISCNC